MKKIQDQLLGDCEATAELLKAFKKQHATVVKTMPRVMARSAAVIATRRLINKASHLWKQCTGSLLKVTRKIKSLNIVGKDDFGENWHTTHSAPYFYDSAYCCIAQNVTIPIDDNGKCIIFDISHRNNKTPSGVKQDNTNLTKWKCSTKCKPIQQTEIDAIVALREAFELHMPQLRQSLHTCDDGCSNKHYSEPVLCTGFDSNSNYPLYTPVEHQGHPLVCFNDGGCTSKLRILRSVATHYPMLKIFLGHLYHAIQSHSTIYNIDAALNGGDFLALMGILKIDDFTTLLGNHITSEYSKELDDSVNIESPLQDSNLESKLIITHSKLMTEFDKDINDYPIHACCSCDCLHQRKSVTRVKLTDNLSTEVWPRLQDLILLQNLDAADEVLYMCNYCKPIIRKEKLPPRCVLNGLRTVPIPPELDKLDSLSRQLIQLAKCYQTVVRLGTYTAKVPIYNSLKACKGTMFFLPLPMTKLSIHSIRYSSPARQSRPHYPIWNYTLFSMVSRQSKNLYGVA